MIFDISVPVSPDLVTWPGDPSVCIEKRASIALGDACNVSALDCGVHTGTHIDAPCHFIDGAKSIEDISLDICYGEAFVCEVEGDVVSADAIHGVIPKGVKRVLFKTSNSDLWSNPTHSFKKDFVALDESAVRYLLAIGIQLIGVDYLSVESFYANEGNPVHRSLLEKQVVLLEGCNLSNIEQGYYHLSALPLGIVGADGAPCRAILVK